MLPPASSSRPSLLVDRGKVNATSSVSIPVQSTSAARAQDGQTQGSPSIATPVSESSLQPSEGLDEANSQFKRTVQTAQVKGPCFIHSYLDRAVDVAQRARGQSTSTTRRKRSTREEDSPSSRERRADSDFEAPQQSGRSGRRTLDSDDEGHTSQEGTRSSGRSRHRGPRGFADDDAHSETSEDSGSRGSSHGSSFTISSDDDEDENKVRSLTRQLAETAVGVREMSKQLGRARVKSNIHSVLIITKARDNHLIKLTRELALWLMLTPRNGRDTGLIVYVDSQLRNSKRFDAEGIQRDHPRLFDPVPHNARRSPSSADSTSSLAATSDSSYGAAGTDQNMKDASGDSAFSSRSTSRSHNGANSGKAEGQLRFWTSDLCSRSPHLFDFVVTLGGDGTVLFCSWLFQSIVPPVLPFALGSLGFLTNFDFKDYQQVMKSALDSGIRVNLRMRFTATVYRAVHPSSTTADRDRRRAIKSGQTGEIIMRTIRDKGWDPIESPGPDESLCRDPDDGGDAANDPRPVKGTKKCRDKEVMCFSTRPVETFEVLNDLVVDRGPSPYVSLLEVFGDEHHMTTAQADGLCISTPTGSTAYSLSAGGSLVHPEIPAILITPICPHTLSFRPMLLPDSMELRIAVPYNSRSTAWASFDGRGRVELRQGDHIKVTASRYPFPTVCAENQSTDWFGSISRTLKWNERQRQKSFVVVEEDREDNKSNKRNDEKRQGKEGWKKPDAFDAEQRSKWAKSDAVTGKPVDASSSNEARGGPQAAQRKNNEADADDEEDEDKDDDDAEEKFDIDDTMSTAVTRSNSPNHLSRHSSRASLAIPNGLSVAGSLGRSASHRPKHLHSNSSSSSVNSRRGSQEALKGLLSFTPADGKRDSRSQKIPKELATSPASVQSADLSSSLLNSPDRFAIAGGPHPPLPVSSRHLASADFRLDDAYDDKTPRKQSKPRQQEGKQKQKQPGKANGTSSHSTSASSSASDATQLATDNAGAAAMGGGGTALVVYGEDDSDSDEYGSDATQ